MTYQEIQDTLKTAQINISEAAYIIQVGRPTVYRILRGVQPKQKIAYQVICRVCERIQKAVEQGHLPLSKDITKNNRRSAIVSALKR